MTGVALPRLGSTAFLSFRSASPDDWNSNLRWYRERKQQLYILLAHRLLSRRSALLLITAPAARLPPRRGTVPKRSCIRMSAFRHLGKSAQPPGLFASRHSGMSCMTCQKLVAPVQCCSHECSRSLVVAFWQSTSTDWREREREMYRLCSAAVGKQPAVRCTADSRGVVLFNSHSNFRAFFCFFRRLFSFIFSGATAQSLPRQSRYI